MAERTDAIGEARSESPLSAQIAVFRTRKHQSSALPSDSGIRGAGGAVQRCSSRKPARSNRGKGSISGPVQRTPLGSKCSGRTQKKMRSHSPTSSAPNRRSHEVQRKSAMRERFRPFRSVAGEQLDLHTPQKKRENPTVVEHGETVPEVRWRRGRD